MGKLKVMKKTILFLLLSTMMFFITSCEKQIVESTNKTYQIRDVEIDGTTYSVLEGVINENLTLSSDYNWLLSVGVFGLGDIYQSPQHFFNLVYNLENKKYDLSVRVNNIFNTSYILSQKTDQGDKIVNKFQTGQEFSIGLKYKI